MSKFQYVTGFDYGVGLPVTSVDWDGNFGNGSNVIQTTTVRNGKGALQIIGSSQSTGVVKNLASVQARFVGGFACWVGAPIWEWKDSTSAANVSMAIVSGTLTVYRGDYFGNSTVLGSYSSVSTSVFHYFEFDILVDPSAGYTKVWMDGVQILNLTGINTKGGTNANIASLILATAPNISTYYDDIYVLDTTVSTTRLGDVAVVGILPSGNGTVNNYTNVFAAWAASTVMSVGQQIKDSNGNVQEVQSVASDAKTGTLAPTWATTGGNTTTDNHVTWVCRGTGANPGAANWMAVSEIPADDNNSYVTDATVNDQDRYVYPAIAGSQVLGVAVTMRAEKDDAGTRTIRAVTKSSATIADNGVDFPLTQNSYQYFQGYFDTDPATGVAWTVSGVNAAEFGVKTIA